MNALPYSLLYCAPLHWSREADAGAAGRARSAQPNTSSRAAEQQIGASGGLRRSERVRGSSYLYLKIWSRFVFLMPVRFGEWGVGYVSPNGGAGTLPFPLPVSIQLYSAGLNLLETRRADRSQILTVQQNCARAWGVGLSALRFSCLVANCSPGLSLQRAGPLVRPVQDPDERAIWNLGALCAHRKLNQSVEGFSEPNEDHPAQRTTCPSQSPVCCILFSSRPINPAQVACEPHKFNKPAESSRNNPIKGWNTDLGKPVA